MPIRIDNTLALGLADGRYLRLDASNSPITGDLSIDDGVTDSPSLTFRDANDQPFSFYKANNSCGVINCGTAASPKDVFFFYNATAGNPSIYYSGKSGPGGMEYGRIFRPGAGTETWMGYGTCIDESMYGRSIGLKSGYNIKLRLGDAAGAREVSVVDSAGNTVGSWDSDGNLDTTTGTLASAEAVITSSNLPQLTVRRTTDGPVGILLERAYVGKLDWYIQNDADLEIYGDDGGGGLPTTLRVSISDTGVLTAHDGLSVWDYCSVNTPLYLNGDTQAGTVFNAGQTGDTWYWMANISDNGADDDDTLQIGEGSTIGNNVRLSLDTSGNFDFYSGTLTGANFISTVADGTSPYACTSTTVNTNLNADLWDGYQFSDYLDQAVKTTSSPEFVDLTMAGYLKNTPAADDAIPFEIDGLTNEYTGSADCYITKHSRKASGSFSAGSDYYVYGDKFNLTNSRVFTGTPAIQRSRTYGLFNEVTIDGNHSLDPGGGGYGEYNYTWYNLLTRTGDLTVANVSGIQNYGVFNYLVDSINYNNAGNSLTVTNYGSYIRVDQTGTLTAGDWTKKSYGEYIYVRGNTAGTTTAYGLYVDAQNADTNYDIYLAGAKNIQFGTDTNLYRSAANVLKTDDSFIANAGLTVNASSTLGDGSDTCTIKDILLLNGITSDPTTPTNGSIWYRSDTGEFRVRANSHTYVLPLAEP